MTRKGLRISDTDITGSYVVVTLQDILKEVYQPYNVFWSILYIDAQGDQQYGKEFIKFMDFINNSENGYCLDWEELVELVNRIIQVYDITVIGSLNKDDLHKYKDDRVMYETCDYTIVMFDSTFWEVFSSNKKFIENLSLKFKCVKSIDSDFFK